MKQPKLSKLEMNAKLTREIRKQGLKEKKVKITINIDHESLNILRKKSERSGVPYQRLLNIVLKEALVQEKKTESRIDQLENEIEGIKRKLAA